MTIPTLTFFNNKGGVGKTTLVYHLSWMFSELGIKTLVVDCDPQANLTAALMKDELLVDLFAEPCTNPGALTMFVVLSRKDFSFLRNALFLGGIGLFAVAIGSMFFGYSLGLLFSAGVVMLMCGYILYETSLIMNHLPTTAHVAGALMIFGSMAELFKHLIFLLSYFQED